MAAPRIEAGTVVTLSYELRASDGALLDEPGATVASVQVKVADGTVRVAVEDEKWRASLPTGVSGRAQDCLHRPAADA